MLNQGQYIINQNSLFNYLIKKKRIEISDIIKHEIKKKKLEINSVLDIGSSSDKESVFSNIILKNLNFTSNIKSITNRKIQSKLFKNILIKSIAKKFSKKIIKNFMSDLVLSSATIEHVGSYNNQKRMIENIGLLTNKIFFITTPYRFFPIEIHTKIPLLHFFPKKIFRKILNLFNYNFFSKEKNLNLLSINELKVISRKLEKKFYLKIKFLKTFFFISNLILIGIKRND